MTTRDSKLLRGWECNSCGYEHPCIGLRRSNRGNRTMQIIRYGGKTVRCEAYRKPGKVANWKRPTHRNVRAGEPSIGGTVL